jgi:hypothetical protein
MAKDVLTSFEKGERCFVCNQQVKDEQVAIVLISSQSAASDLDLLEHDAELGDILIDLDWSDQKLAHVSCLLKGARNEE